ncbi:hypothetical protein BO70DRAFT_357176, partial [Aspergillus heteromorphus CBS 117.55]
MIPTVALPNNNNTGSRINTIAYHYGIMRRRTGNISVTSSPCCAGRGKPKSGSNGSDLFARNNHHRPNFKAQQQRASSSSNSSSSRSNPRRPRLKAKLKSKSN